MEKSQKEKLTNKEISKLKKAFVDILGSSQKDIALRLIKEIAYMSVTLDELKKDMGSTTEHFVQGSQNMVVISAALKGYNALVKNYTIALKQLEAMIPADMGDNKKDDFDKFMKGN